MGRSPRRQHVLASIRIPQSVGSRLLGLVGKSRSKANGRIEKVQGVGGVLDLGVGFGVGVACSYEYGYFRSVAEKQVRAAIR